MTGRKRHFGLVAVADIFTNQDNQLAVVGAGLGGGHLPEAAALTGALAGNDAVKTSARVGFLHFVTSCNVKQLYTNLMSTFKSLQLHQLNLKGKICISMS